jgi:MtN3 and saliva related transmembrane protein
MVEWIGLISGALTTIAFVPQVMRTWRTRSAADLSLGMLVTFTTGVLGWLVYGLLSHQLPVILSNVVMLVLSGVLLALKVRFR